MSLALVEDLQLPLTAAVLDVGGGASTFVDGLVGRGHVDVSVLDVSPAALAAARRRIPPTAGVHWICHDVLTWEPNRTYELWHDRAVFHFLTAPGDRSMYLDRLDKAVARGGYVIIGTFAPDGPQRCSGLAVHRYGAEELAALLGPGFRLILGCREEHRTPGGAVQPFTWTVAGRQED